MLASSCGDFLRASLWITDDLEDIFTRQEQNEENKDYEVSFQKANFISLKRLVNSPEKLLTNFKGEKQ